MTIPESLIFPNPPDRVLEEPARFQQYIREMIFTLQRMYEDVAQGINGDIRTNDDIGNRQYLPAVFGVSSAGAGTYAADKQIGWVLRQGLMVDVWFDVTWTAHTGTGNLYLELPYLVANSLEKPFVGVLQVSNLTYTGDYCVMNAIPNTRRGEIWVCSAGAATANVAMDTSAQIMGHIRYVGQAIERS